MNTLSKVGLVLVTMFIVSCSDLTDLDINQNPNAPSPENAEIGFLYNKVQLAFAGTGTAVGTSTTADGDGFIPSTWAVTSTATRMRAMTSFFYREQYQDVSFNNMWNDAYSLMLPDVTAIENLASEGTAFLYEANTARIMKAYVMTSLVDIFGDVPLAEAGLGTDQQNPANQDGASIYAAAEELLDQAIAGLAEATTSPSNDLFYGGDKSKWITLANTLKLRIYNNTRLVDQSAGSKMMAIISAGDFIDDESEDFEFQFSSNRNDPDGRHPFYDTDYEQTDGGYMNNYYMWLLVGDKPMRDPRTRFYFYRQQSVFSEANININDWDCVITNNPFDQIPPGSLDHVFAVDPNLPFCIAAADGYMGRDHGNGQGIPPDGPLRVEYGVYPAGGRWDNNSFANTQNSGIDGALGEGIQPIWQSSWTDFIRAEAALTAGTGEDARALLESAVRKSIAKVLSFQANVPAADLNAVIASDPVTGEQIFADVLIPTEDDIDAYVAEVMSRFDASSDKLDVVMTEYYIAIWGNGIESYNNYRRTMKPNNMAPLIDPLAASSASFPRTMLYPAVNVNLNQNATQKNTDTQVFWDTNPAGAIR